MAKVFLGLPHYGDLAPHALPGLVQASPRGQLATMVLGGGSLLALGFNKLWCQALNERAQWGLTHFAMHHADVAVATPGWLDVLLEEMERVGADVLSTVIPIKDGRGLTTTGVRDPQGGRIRRFTMKEVKTLPTTFCVADTPFPQEWLMVNTGLWVCKITEPWAEQVCFNIIDAVIKDEDGTFKARALSEDWNFSGWCARQGLKVFATQAVAVAHFGKACYGNDTAWGDWDRDQGDTP
jgi:hypothetical protein